MEKKPLLIRFRWLLFIVIMFGGQLAGTAYLYHDSKTALTGFVIFLFGWVTAVVLNAIDETTKEFE